ncbi:MAG: leucine--tRNA ligase [Thermoplasmata archaeon]|nr:MAG: leucine--tRNA ligase [Thermoplasmata archaeon]
MNTIKSYDYTVVEKKWQDKWFRDRIYEAKKDGGKKFFIHFAYPGVSGYLHVGHMRGFTYCDIIARYKRMSGYNVLFPAGFHASGIPSVAFAKKVERGDRETIALLQKNGCSDEIIKKLSDPREVVHYFSKVYVEDYWKRFGFLIDYSRLMDTISKGYNRFIQWQFHKLYQKNLLIQKPHFAPYCPQCGPVAVDKSETDVSKGGNAEILEFTIIKFKMRDGTILPAATLRPETIFGVTNMWVNPDAIYQKIRIDNEIWICSKECTKKLSYQMENIELLYEEVKGKDLVGKTCFVPLINREIPILSGTFVDPNIATGLVMSVPAHAPYDWIALVESKKDIDPIQIIDVKGFGTNPAKEVCEQLNIHSQTETEKLDQATEILYKKEFHTGFLNENCGVYAGIKVSDIKDQVRNDLIEKKLATVMREFSEEVICRCGEKVVIKQIPDQWFIKYSDENLTEMSKQHVSSMNIYPQEYKEEMPKVLEWFDDRAVIRKGSWLGTEFPFKKNWIIEPISDSTLYPAYYIVSKYVNENKIISDEMTNEFFDYIFLGIGKAKNNTWRTIRSDFEYWYPVDINLGGKEHKTVHFPVFLMNHVAVMPERKWPKGIFVHWWVTQKGREKISKSKGGAEPIPQAATTYGVDAMRLYYAHVGSPFVDVEWDPEVVNKYKNRIINIWKFINQLIKTRSTKEDKHLDKWLKSIINRRIQKIIDAFEKYDIRVASNEIFFEIQKDLQWYLKRNGGNKKLLEETITTWIKLMTPIIPHLAEEIWHILGRKNYISNETYPTPNPMDISEEDELGEQLISQTIKDIHEILKVTRIKAKKIHIYTASSWKHKMMQQAIELEKENKLDMKNLMKTAISELEMKDLGKEVSSYANKIIGEIKKMNESDKKQYTIPIDEKKHLEQSVDFLKKEFSTDFEIHKADEKNIYDPMKRAKLAVPLRPAIFIE